MENLNKDYFLTNNDKTKKRRFKSLIKTISKKTLNLVLATVLSLGILTVNANINDSAVVVRADDLSNTVPTGEYDGTHNIYTVHDDTAAVTGDTIVGPGKPYVVDNVVQSRSQNSATTFASGLPLSTIYIDQSKITGDENAKNCTFQSLPGPYSSAITRDAGSGVITYNAITGPKQILGGQINTLEGPLFYVEFPKAAILPNGDTANLRITYSDARIVVDQRYDAIKDQAGNTLVQATAYAGKIRLATGPQISYGGDDNTDITGMYRASDRQTAVQQTARKYNTSQTFSSSSFKKPFVGMSIDATYQIVDNNGTPVPGTFIFAIAGINLDRDPYRGVNAGNNAGKPLWYVNDMPGGSDYHFFSEAMSINDGMASDYIYVRSNDNGDIGDDNKVTPTTNWNNNGSTYPVKRINQANFWPQVTTDSNGNTKFIGNAEGNRPSSSNLIDDSQGSDTSYSNGFVTLADAAAGLKVTATGHGGSGSYYMNTTTFVSSTIWYRYVSGSGDYGRIELTSEGNSGGNLSDGGDILDGGTLTVPNTYVVTEGKTVTYTMTPNIGYKLKKLTINGTEVKFNNNAVSSMKKGDTLTIETNDYNYWVSPNTLENADPSKGQGILKYNEDGTYTFTFNHAKADEEIFVEWEPTTADVYAYKIWDDDNDKDGIRFNAEKSNTLPKLKLQWSLNGRDWNDVSSPMQIGSVTYTFPTYARTVQEETVPAGKVNGNYKDGTYEINYDTTGDHPFTWEYLPVYTYDSNGVADRAIRYRIVEVNDPWHQEYHNAEYLEQQVFDLLSSKENTADGWTLYTDQTTNTQYVQKGDGKYYEVDSEGYSKKIPATTQPNESNLVPTTSSEYWTVDKAITYHEVQAKNTHFTTELYVDVTKVWDDRALLDLPDTTIPTQYARKDINIILSGKTFDGTTESPVDLNGNASGNDLVKTITTTEGDDKANVTGTVLVDGFPKYEDSLHNEFVKIYNHSTYDNGYYAITATGIDYNSGPVQNLPDLSPVKKGDGTFKYDDYKYGVMFEDLPTHHNGREVIYSVKETDTSGAILNEWVLTGGKLTPVKNSSGDLLGYTTTLTNTPDIEDVYTPLPIKILKRDINSKEALEDAEFTIYTDAVIGDEASQSKTELVGAKTIYSKNLDTAVTRYVIKNGSYYVIDDNNNIAASPANPQPTTSELTEEEDTFGGEKVYRKTEQNVTTRYVVQNGNYYELDASNNIASSPADPQPNVLELSEAGVLGGETGYSDGTNKYVKKGDDKYYLVDANGNIATSPASPQPDTNLIEESKDLKTGDVEKNVVITGKDGCADVKFLKEGTYYIKETKAPKGYEADPTIYVFDVDPKLKKITLKSASGDHTTSWWEKLYDLIFGNNTTTATNWDSNAKVLTVDDKPITANVLVRKYWNDNDNQDGKRPGDSSNPTSTTHPNLPTVKLEYTTGAHTAEGLNVYTNGQTGSAEKKYVRKNDNYYEVTKEDVVGEYNSSSAASPQPTGTITKNNETSGGLDVYVDSSTSNKYVIIDQKYHEVTSVDEIGTVASTPATTQPDANQLSLVMDGTWTVVKVKDGNTTKDASEKVNYVGGPVLTHQNDAYTWTDLPAYEGGKLVTYRINETGDILDKTKEDIYAYDIESIHTSQTHDKTFHLVDTSGTTPTRLNQTVDVTNKHETQVVNIEVYKEWQDEDETDRGTTPINIKLYKVVNGIETIVTKGTGTSTQEDIGTVPTTDETKAIKIWTDLPTYEGGYPVTYRLREDSVTGYLTLYKAQYTNTKNAPVTPETNEILAEDIKRTYYANGDAIPNSTKKVGEDGASKKVGDESTTAKFEILNERSVNVKVEKTWVNGANANVTFELWRTITPEASLTTSKLTGSDVATTDDNKYYVRRTITLTETQWNALTNQDEKDAYTLKYKHNTDNTIISEREYNNIKRTAQAQYEEKYVNNSDSSDVITPVEWSKLDPSTEQINYTQTYINKNNDTDRKTLAEYNALGDTEQANYSPIYVDDSHEIITSDTYDAITDAAKKAEYVIEQSTSWSPYAGGGKDASTYVLKSNGAGDIAKAVYDRLGDTEKELYKPKTVDGWELVDSHLFDSNAFGNSNTGIEITYSFNNLLIKDGDGHEYLYRVLEKPAMMRFRENQISNTEVINNNLNASDGVAALEVVKEIDGRDWLDNDNFHFYLEPVKGINVTDKNNPVDIDQNEVPMPYRVDSTTQKKTYNYTADATKSDQQVGAIGRAATFQNIQYKEHSDDYYDIPRNSEVEFYYKVYEIYNTKTDRDTTNNKDTITKDKELDEITEHTGYYKGITYDGDFLYEENTNGKYILASDGKYYLATDTLPTGVTDTDNTKKYSPKFNEDTNGKYILGSDGIYYLATETLPSGVKNDDESKKYTPQQFNPIVHEAKVVVTCDNDGKILTDTYWKKNGKYVKGAVPVYTNTYSSEGIAKIWIEKKINDRAWVDFDNANQTGDAFEFKIDAISGAELNVPGSTINDSYTTKPLMSNGTNNPQTDIQKMSNTEYAFGVTGNKYDNTMLNSQGYAYFIYEISEDKVVNYPKQGQSDPNFNISDYAVDGLNYDDNKIYVKIKAKDNWNGTISFEVDYFTDASCKEDYRIKNRKAWIYDDDTETNEGKYLLSMSQVEAIENLTKEQIAATYPNYREINVAYFANSETVDIPVMKKWVNGPAVEDVNLHLKRHLFDLSTVESEINDQYVKERESQNGFWETAGYTHYARRADFVDANGPIYDEDSKTTSSGLYENISGFNLNLPKYEVKDGKTYRIVYRLEEDETSDAYRREYSSVKYDISDEEKDNYSPKYVNNDNNLDIISPAAYEILNAENKAKYTPKYVKEIITENDYIYTDGEILVVTNTVVAHNTANIAAVKQLRDRNWLESDDFKFILTPVGKATYDNEDKINGITPTTDIPMPSKIKEYVNKNDSTDTITIEKYNNYKIKSDYTLHYSNNTIIKTEEEYNELTIEEKEAYHAVYVNNSNSTDVIEESVYNALPTVSKDNYEAVYEVDNEAHAKIDHQVVDPNGNLERLARFGEIEYTIDDLVFNNTNNHMHGDFFYTIKEDIPSTAIAYNKTNGEKVPNVTFTEEERENYIWKGTNGITYDSSIHTVHVSVKENRSEELQVLVSYDDFDLNNKVVKETGGTQFTPVFTNRYEATKEIVVEIDKYILGRDWVKYNEENKTGDVFDFRMTAMGGAPFKDADRSEFPTNDTHSDDERETDLEAEDAIHSARGAHVKRMFVKDTTKEVQKLNMPKLLFSLSDLNKTVTSTSATGNAQYSLKYVDSVTDPENVSIIPPEQYEGLSDKGNYVQKYVNDNDDEDIIDPTTYDSALKYTDGTIVPAGTAYGQFVYSFEETNDYLDKANKTVKDLSKDDDTEYARITVIDKGNGTLDYYSEIFEDRYCQVPRYKPGTTELAENPTFVNQLKRELSITKTWVGPASSDVILLLQWSIDGEHFYNVDQAEWLPSGVRYSQTISKNAFGSELTKTWYNLPAYANITDITNQKGDDSDLNDKWVYYQIIEETIPNVTTRYSATPYVAGESYNNTEKYKDAKHSPHTGPEKDNQDNYVTDRVKQLYVTNWRDVITGEANVGVVKQYIGKEWVDEEFTFLIEPVESMIGSETEPIANDKDRKTGNYVKIEDESVVISAAEYNAIITEDPSKASDYKEEIIKNVMPAYDDTNGNEAKATKGTTKVSVNERAANFDPLSIKLTDLAVDTRETITVDGQTVTNPNFGKAVGTFYYKVYEQVPADSVVTEEVCGKDIEDKDVYYKVADDEKGNKIKYTTEEHLVKIFAVDDGSGKIDVAVSYDDRQHGEFVPVYTNYAMEKTPITGTKTWIGGENSEHVNGTVTLEENDTKITASNDALGLQLQRKLDKDTTATALPENKDDAGRKLVVVWAKATEIKETITTYAYTEDGTTKIIDDDHPVISQSDYEALTDETEIAKYIPHETQEVVIGYKYKEQVGYDATNQTGGDASPYTYTIMAKDSEGNYVQPILNTTDKDGNLYTYSIVETSKPSKYEDTYDDLDITNTYNATDSLKVTKTWDDDADNKYDAEGLRPENSEVKVHLYKVVTEGEGQSATTRLVQVENEAKTITSTTPSADGGSVTWANLPVYDENGDKIKYVILEEAVAGYTTKYLVPGGSYVEEGSTPATNTGLQVELDGDTTSDPQVVNVKNELTPATTKVEVKKVWDDNDNVDNSRPQGGVEFTLYERVWNGTAYGTEAQAKYANGRNVPTLTLDGTVDANQEANVKETLAWEGEFAGLAATKNGKTVIYYVKETSVGNGYSDPVYTGNQLDGYTITNTRKQDVVTVDITKTWSDYNNLLGVRPETITYTLKRTYLGADNTTKVALENVVVDNQNVTLTLSAEDKTNDNVWKDKVENLPKNIRIKTSEEGASPEVYANREIIYVWEEVVPIGYTASGTYQNTEYTGQTNTAYIDTTGDASKSGTITNVLKEGVIEITKTWADDNNKDKARNVNNFVSALTLYANNTKVTGVTPTVSTTDNTTVVTYSNLPIYNQAGTAINYSLVEAPIDGYTMSVAPVATTIDATTKKGLMTLTNTHTPDLVSYTFTKTWDDSNNVDGKRPTINQYKDWITLYRDVNGANEENVTETYKNNLTVIDNNDGAFIVSWTGLAKNNPSGNAYRYYAKETLPANSYYQAIIGNTTVNPANTAVTTGVIIDAITNKQIYKDITVRKIWNDKIYDLSNNNNIVSPNRPDSVKLTLTGSDSTVTGYMKTDTVSSVSRTEDTFAHTFVRMPMFTSSGAEMIYTLSESDVPGYHTKSETIGGVLTVVNTLQVTKFTGTKVWVDGNLPHNNYEDVELTLHYALKKNNEYTSHGTIRNPHIDWNGNKFEIVNLPVADSNGNTYEYWVSETKVDGYLDPSYSVQEIVDTIEVDSEPVPRNGIKTGGTITNTIKNEQVSLTGNKVWLDPVGDSSLTINHDNAEQVKLIVHQVLGNSDLPLTENTHYTVAWTDNTYTITNKDNGMPKYDPQGNEYTYYVVESPAVSGYDDPTYSGSENDRAYDGETITNRNQKLDDKVVVEVTKAWAGDNNNENSTRGPVTITLYKEINGATSVVGEPKTIPADATEDDLTVKWENLDKYDKNDTRMLINYSIEETVVPNGYTRTISPVTPTTVGNTTTHKYTVTNTYENDSTYMTVVKKWADNNNQDGLRPSSISVNLTAKDSDNDNVTPIYLDGTNVTSVTLSDSNNWKYTFNNLPVRTQEGKAITYSVEESEMDTSVYTANIEYNNNRNLATITNTYQPKTITVKVNKVWDEDTENALGLGSSNRKDVVLHLYGYYQAAQTGVSPYQDNNNKLAYIAEDKTIALNADPASVTWNNLPSKLNGTTLTWKVYEEAIPGYRAEYGDPSVDTDGNVEITVTNKYYGPVETIKARKVWDDSDNVDEKRPSSVTFKLFRTVGTSVEEEVADSEKTINAFTNNMSEYVEWNNLPTSMVVNGVEQPIVYSVEEVISDALRDAGYNSVVLSTGPGVFEVRNSRNVDSKKIIVNKVWNDSQNAEGVRPNDIVVELLADGTKIEDAVIYADSNWSHTFENLPINKTVEGNKVAINYTVVEKNIPSEYSSTVSPPSDSSATETIVTITNTLRADKVAVKVRKVWKNDSEHTDLRKDINALLLNSSEQIIKVGMIKLDDPSAGFDVNTKDSEGYYEWQKLPMITKVDDKGTPETDDDEVVLDPDAYSIKEVEIDGYLSTTKLDKIEGNVYYFTIENVYEEDKETYVTYINPRNIDGNMILRSPDKYPSMAAAQAASKDPSVVPSVPEYDGYDFLGWSSNYDPAVGFIMVATYNPKDVKLVTYVDPLAASPIVKSEYAQNPATVTDPSDPGHSGYTFDGWVETIDEAGNVIRVATFKCVCPSSGPCPINPSGYVPPRTGIQLGLASIMAIVTGVGVIISAGIKR